MSQIVVPAAARSVITPVAQTTFQVGTYAPLNDTFTKTLDLNDHASYWLVKVNLPQPEKVYARTSTIRAAGERITNWNYKNRHITVTLQLLYQSNTTALLQAARALLAAIENPPYRLAFAPPNAGVLTYADVVAVKHTIPSDAKVILAKAISNITIDFECAPGFSGDRITLQNLVSNPGFEAPSGPGVAAFTDAFPNVSAYSVLAGSAPTVAANVMTIPNGAQVAFGSPAWGPINIWQVRFQWATGLTAVFNLHQIDGSNRLAAQIDSNLYITHVVGGTAHNMGVTAVTLTAGTWYWIRLTQFPSAPGTQCSVVATIYADSSGAAGAQVATTGVVQSYDSVTALTGRPAIWAAGTAALAIGGAFASVHLLQLFGPGGWGFVGTNGGTSIGSGAWDQNTANTYSGGAVTSYGAARHDLPPAGSVNAFWETFSGGTPTGSNAIPASTGQVMAASVYARSSGLSGTATLQLQVREWDVNGNFLRSTTLQSVTGNQASWVKLSGTATMGASTVYCSVLVSVVDMAAGASANGTVWWDNAQCWNQTTTGQTVMPYCELRFPQSPAQLLLTGLQGDMSAPAAVALGTYKSGLGAGHIVYAWLGSKASPIAAAQLVSPPLVPPVVTGGGSFTPSLDASQFGGYYYTDADILGPGSYGSLFYAFSTPPASLAGIYHIFERLWTTNSNNGAITAQASVSVSTDQYDQSAPTHPKRRALVQGATLNPLVAANNWDVCDCGQIIIPPFGRDVLLDNSKNYVTPYVSWTDPNGNNYSYRHTWQALLPVDGSVLVATLINGSSAAVSTSNPYLWMYADGLGQFLGYDPSWHYSFEPSALANPGAGVGGTGTTNSLSASINPTADAFIQVDPNQSSNGVSGVAQLVGILTDDNSLGTVLPCLLEVQYSPLYLYPREQ